MARRLTGAEARAWLQAHPNASYIDNTTGQRVERQKTGIENLVSGLTKPLRQGVGIGQEFGLTIRDLLNVAKGNDQEVGKRSENLLFNTAEESRAIREDPLKAGIKSAAGLVSYGIPAGAAKGVTGLRAIGQAAGKGALAGGMGGFGYSEEGKELESILKGGALGGVIGGGLQAVKGISGAVRSRGESIKQGADSKIAQLKASDQALLKDKQRLIDTIDEQISQAKSLTSGKSSQYLTELDKQIASGGISTIDDVLPISDSTRKTMYEAFKGPKGYEQAKLAMIDDMMSSGLSVANADDIANSWADYLNIKYTQKGDILTKVGDQMVDATRTSQALKKVSKIIGDDATLSKMLDDGLQDIFGKGTTIDKVPQTLSAAQVTAIKELADQVGGGGGALFADTSSQISQQLLNKVRSASRDIVTDIKPLDDILNQISDAHKLKSAVYEAPVVFERITEKGVVQGQQQLGNLAQQRAREITRLGERGESLAQRNLLRVQNLEQKKLQIADDLANTARDLSERYQFSMKLPWPVTELTQNKIPLGGDVRAPMAGIRAGVGSVMSKFPNIDKGLGTIAAVGQRAVPGIIGASSFLPEKESISQQGLPVEAGEGQLAGQYTQYDALNEAMSMFPGASETELITIAKYLYEANQGGGGKASAKDYSNASAGLQALNQLETVLQGSPGLLAPQLLGKGDLASIVGGKDYQNYQTWAYNAADLMLRIRTGAQANEQEIRMYMDKFLPKWYESPEAKQTKIQMFRDYFNGIINGEIPAGDMAISQGELSDQYGDY